MSSITFREAGVADVEAVRASVMLSERMDGNDADCKAKGFTDAMDDGVKYYLIDSDGVRAGVCELDSTGLIDIHVHFDRDHAIEAAIDYLEIKLVELGIKSSYCLSEKNGLPKHVGEVLRAGGYVERYERLEKQLAAV